MFRAVQKFMDAVEIRIGKQADEIRTLRDELIQTRASVPVITPQPSMDFEAIATRAALLVPAPVIDINAIAKQAADLVPVPADGKDGKDGQDAPAVNVEEIVAQVAEAAIPRITAAIPVPAKGDKGDAGADGKAAVEVNVEEIVARVAEIAIPRVAAIIPVPKDGEKGERGADGIATREELDSLAEERFADLKVRTLADSWQGVWMPDKEYERGVIVQWDGSPWLALARTKSKPGSPQSDWILFAKKGRDARK